MSRLAMFAGLVALALSASPLAAAAKKKPVPVDSNDPDGLARQLAAAKARLKAARTPVARDKAQKDVNSLTQRLKNAKAGAGSGLVPKVVAPDAPAAGSRMIQGQGALLPPKAAPIPGGAAALPPGAPAAPAGGLRGLGTPLPAAQSTKVAPASPAAAAAPPPAAAPSSSGGDSAGSTATSAAGTAKGMMDAFGSARKPSEGAPPAPAAGAAEADAGAADPNAPPAADAPPPADAPPAADAPAADAPPK